MRKWYPVVLIALAIITAAVCYGRLPETVPTHWDAQGDVNGYSSRLTGVLLMPIAMIGIWGILTAVPKIDPRKENYARMGDAYGLVVNATMTIMFAIHLVLLAAMLGLPISITRAIPALVGAMFIVIGNVLPQARPNFFFGIRTPWTLSNDRVWYRTHRIGGYLFVACGIIMLLSVLLPSAIRFPILLAGGAVAGLGSVIFSFIAWKQETSK